MSEASATAIIKYLAISMTYESMALFFMMESLENLKLRISTRCINDRIFGRISAMYWNEFE